MDLLDLFDFNSIKFECEKNIKLHFIYLIFRKKFLELITILTFYLKISWHGTTY